MKIKHFVALGAAACAAAAGLVAGPAGAQVPTTVPPPEPIGTMSVDPPSAPAGSVISVSGTGCVSGGAIEAGLVDPASGVGVAFGDTHADISGNWVVELPVPDAAQQGDVFRIEGECIAEGGGVYEPVDFVVSAARPELTIAISPTSGPIGTVIQVSGSGCLDGGVIVALLGVDPATGETTVVDALVVERAEDGTWSAELIVFDKMFRLAGPVQVDVVPGDYTVQASCDLDVTEPLSFVVTGGGTAPPRTDPPVIPPFVPVTPVAQPATAVPGDPDYTG
jgi:hypothetical protein